MAADKCWKGWLGPGLGDSSWALSADLSPETGVRAPGEGQGSFKARVQPSSGQKGVETGLGRPPPHPNLSPQQLGLGSHGGRGESRDLSAQEQELSDGLCSVPVTLLHLVPQEAPGGSPAWAALRGKGLAHP